jgi:hypothetical protein
MADPNLSDEGSVWGVSAQRGGGGGAVGACRQLELVVPGAVVGFQPAPQNDAAGPESVPRGEDHGSRFVYRRCGCRDEATGKLLGPRCPGLSSQEHGSWYFMTTCRRRRESGTRCDAAGSQPRMRRLQKIAAQRPRVHSCAPYRPAEGYFLRPTPA